MSIQIGQHTLVESVSFTVRAQQHLAIVGPSGAGKTLLCRTIANITPPHLTHTGTITITPVTQEAPAHPGRIAWVGQDTRAALNPLQKIGKQIAEPARTHGLTKHAAQELALHNLDLMELANPAETFTKYPGQLSGGERQRAAIALALTAQPDLIIADEPSAALDSQTAALALQALVANTDASLLLVTHDLHLAATLCDQALALEPNQPPQIVNTMTLVNAQHQPQIEQHTKTTVPAGDSAKNPTETQHCAAPAHTSEPPELTHDTSGLQCTQVSRTFAKPGQKPVTALDAVTFAVRRGEKHAIIGPSGAGKSTLLKLLLGQDKPTTGQVTLDGNPLLNKGNDHAFARQVQYIPQHTGASLNPRRTIAWSIAEPLVCLGSDLNHQDRVAELLTTLDLPQEMATRLPRQLSGGQKQRVAIARALAPQPEILLIDEPTSALDANTARKVIDALLQANTTQGCGYVVITHDITAAHQLADHLTVIDHGRVVEHGSTQQIINHPQHSTTRKLLEASVLSTPIH